MMRSLPQLLTAGSGYGMSEAFRLKTRKEQELHLGVGSTAGSERNSAPQNPLLALPPLFLIYIITAQVSGLSFPSEEPGKDRATLAEGYLSVSQRLSPPCSQKN